MRHGNYLNVGVMVLAAFAVQAIFAQASAAPKRKKLPPAATITDPTKLPMLTTFIIFDVGPLRMTGKKATDMTYRVGKLQMSGRGGASTIYNVGTLSMTGKLEP